MKQKIKYITTSAVAVFVVCIFLFTPLFQLYPQSLEDELDQVKKDKQQTQKEIEDAKKAETEYTSQVNEVEANLLKALSELNDLNSDFDKVKSEIDRINIELAIKDEKLEELEKKLQEKKGILNIKVASIYKSRNNNLIELLFKSDNFIEFFSKLKFMNVIAQQDVQIINEIKENREAIINVKNSIILLRDKERKQKANIEILVDKEEHKKAEIENIYYEKKRLLSETTANKNALIEMEKQLEAKEAEITKKLEALRYGNAPGSMLFPVRGILTSGFGVRTNPITGTIRLHTGIDIGCQPGSPVVAAADGEVIQTDYSGGYGYAILIYHGGGFATFYAHLSGFTVSPGQKVKKGQVIGYSGATGWVTGPHLHFEVRINGAPQNPLGYL